MYPELILGLFQLLSIILVLYYNDKVLDITLEKYIENEFHINIANGILFGLMHLINIIYLEYTSMFVVLVNVGTNIYFGYYLAIIHDNLVKCMIIHIIYNFIGYTSAVLCNKYINN